MTLARDTQTSEYERQALEIRKNRLKNDEHRTNNLESLIHFSKLIHLEEQNTEVSP